MIKKSVFEDELIAGMQRELQPFQKKAAVNDLTKAAEYLHSAIEIFEEAGMTAKADQVLNILAKIASAEEEKEDSAPADDNEVAGKKDFYENVMKWIENPETPIEKEEEPTPEVFEFKSLMEPQQLPPDGEELVFKSIAQELGLDDNDAKPRKPKNPTKVHNPTSEQMVENLKNHGTVFNMADDGNADVPQPESFDEDYKKWLLMRKKKITQEDIDPDLVGLIQLDEGDADDLLNLEVSEDPIEVMDPGVGKTFEDSD